MDQLKDSIFHPFYDLYVMWPIRYKQKCQVSLLRTLKEWRRALFVSYLSPVYLNLDVIARVLPTISDYSIKVMAIT